VLNPVGIVNNGAVAFMIVVMSVIFFSCGLSKMQTYQRSTFKFHIFGLRVVAMANDSVLKMLHAIGN